MTNSQRERPGSIPRVFERATMECGKSNSKFVRLAGMKRDSLSRSLNGEFPVSLEEVLRKWEGSKLSGKESVSMLTLADDDFALIRLCTDLARFLGELFKQAPVEIIDRLGEHIGALSSRTANGTAELLPRTLTQQDVDINRSGDAIGERLKNLC